MNKLKIAKAISTITSIPILSIPLFLIISLVLSFNSEVFNLNKFISLEIFSLIFASFLPMAIILFWAKKLGTDRDISNRTDRFTPLIVSVISYFIGFLICMIFNLDNFLTLLLLCYSINTCVVCIITAKWKISIHTTGLSGPVAALILLLGPIGALFGILYPVLIWSRVILNKHTLSQAITGGVQGFFLTVLEIYLFMNLFNFNIIGLVSLTDSIYYILAIIITPVILGILSYNKKSKIIFIIAEIICLVVFLVFLPINILVIFIAVSLTSILVSVFAGSEFAWNDVLT